MVTKGVKLIDYVSAYPKKLPNSVVALMLNSLYGKRTEGMTTDMATIPCQECGNEFDHNTAKAIVNRQGQLVAPPVCFTCIDDFAFTLFEDAYRETHLERAEGRASDVERVARVTWNRYKSGNAWERAIVEAECDRARHVLLNHPRWINEVLPPQAALITNPYAPLCPKAGQTLSEYLQERGWPEGVLPMPILGKEVHPHTSKIVVIQPPVFCKPFMLLVEYSCSLYFQLRDLRQGPRSLFLDYHPIAASQFAMPLHDDGTTFAHKGIILEFHSMSPAERLSMEVENMSDFPWDFRACLLCIVDKDM